MSHFFRSTGRERVEFFLPAGPPGPVGPLATGYGLLSCPFIALLVLPVLTVGVWTLARRGLRAAMEEVADAVR